MKTEKITILIILILSLTCLFTTAFLELYFLSMYFAVLSIMLVAFYYHATLTEKKLDRYE